MLVLDSKIENLNIDGSYLLALEKQATVCPNTRLEREEHLVG